MSNVAGGGGGYAGTPWYRFDVPDMWAMLAAQETGNHAKQVAGWKKAAELTDTHRRRLQEYREELVAAWPPERSAAAREYVDRLDYLIESVGQTYEVAAANCGIASSAVTAITRARSDLKKIYDEYVSLQRARQPGTSGRPTPTPAPMPGTPPVDDAEFERLNTGARRIMFQLGGELSLAQTQLRPPPVYKPPLVNREQNSEDHYPTSSPPPIPSIMTVPTGTYTPPAQRGVHSAVATVPAPNTPGAGPILGGAGPAPALPAGGATIPGIATPPPTPPVPNSFPPALPGPGVLPPPSYGGGVPANPANGPLMKPGGGGVTGTPRAMPPGGLIGGASGAGLGQPGAAGSSVRRINPIGGVIGDRGAGYRIVSARGIPGATWRSHSRGDGSEKRWDPDDPWATEEGVAPVVLPPAAAGRIDPGPAIGLDR